MKILAIRLTVIVYFMLYMAGAMLCIGTSGCALVVESLMETTECLDFQHTSKEAKVLFAKNRVGMSKSELLAEIAEVEYGRQAQKGYNDCVRIAVMFPSNIAESVIMNVNSVYWDYELSFAVRRILAHSHDNSNKFSIGRWKTRRDGFEVRIFAKEWHLATADEFQSFMYPHASQSGGTACTDSYLSKKEEHNEERFCLRESCCWVIYTRKQEGVNLAVMGSIMYDAMIVEFDESGIVLRQQKISWGIGDG